MSFRQNAKHSKKQIINRGHLYCVRFALEFEMRSDMFFWWREEECFFLAGICL